MGGNHDLEGIDEFATDKENLEAYLYHMGRGSHSSTSQLNLSILTQKTHPSHPVILPYPS